MPSKYSEFDFLSGIDDAYDAFRVISHASAEAVNCLATVMNRETDSRRNRIVAAAAVMNLAAMAEEIAGCKVFSESEIRGAELLMRVMAKEAVTETEDTADDDWSFYHIFVRDDD